MKVNTLARKIFGTPKQIKHLEIGATETTLEQVAYSVRFGTASKNPQDAMLWIQNYANQQIKESNKILDDVILKWGATHFIEKRMGTEVELSDLKQNESVCFGDGKTYHFILTKKLPNF